MERDFSSTVTLFVLEDSNALKIPSDILNLAGFVPGEVAHFEVMKEKIVISKGSLTQKNTLESLFKDYDDMAFKTNIIDLGDPIGEEKW